MNPMILWSVFAIVYVSLLSEASYAELAYNTRSHVLWFHMEVLCFGAVFQCGLGSSCLACLLL